MPSDRSLRRAGSISTLALANIVMSMIILVPTAAAQGSTDLFPPPPTFDEPFAMPDSASEFYEANPGTLVAVGERVRADFNGDGIEDVVAVVPGESGGLAVRVLSGWNPRDGYTIAGPAGETTFGLVTIGVPDLDGDGIDDLVITAPESDANAPDAGRVFAYSGIDGALLWTLVGSREGGTLGLAAESAGDVNGDGLHDIIIGEPSPNTGLPGRAFVVLGRERPVAALTLETSDAYLALSGSFADDHFGRAVASAGDADGDGRDDVLVGAPNSDLGDPAAFPRAGVATIFNGVSGSTIATVLGAAPDRQLGASIASIGDRDGDGRADIAVGAPGVLAGDANNELLPGHGRVHVFSSLAWAQAPTTLAPQQAQTTLELADAAAVGFGLSIHLGRDANADGVRDILIGGAIAEEIVDIDEPALNPGERAYRLIEKTHVYSGSDGALLYSFNTAEGSGRIIEIEYPGPTGSLEGVSLFGDVDANLTVETRDATLVMADIGTIDPSGSLTTDVNGDGVVDGWDAVNVLMYVDQAAAIALAESMLGPDDCFDENGVPLPTCECLERHILIVNPEDLDCDDDTGGGDDPGPGPGPGPEEDCDSLPRETTDDCLDYAECVANDEFLPLIEDIGQQLRDLDDQIEQIQSQYNDAVVACRQAVAAKGRALARAVAAAQAPIIAAAAARIDTLGGRMVSRSLWGFMGGAAGIAGSLGLIGTGPPGWVILLGVGASAGAGIYAMGDALQDGAFEMEDAIAAMQAELDAIDAAAAGLDANMPDSLNGMTLWSGVTSAQAALANTVASCAASVAQAYQQAQDAYEPIREEQDRLNEELGNLLIARDLRRQDALQNCLTELEPTP